MDKQVILVISIPILLYAVVLLLKLLLNFREYHEILGNLNVEISRNSGHSQEYWKRKKRKFYLSILPIVGWFVR